MARWKIIRKRPVPLTIVFENKFVASGSVDIDIKNKHFHLNLNEDTYNKIMSIEDCEFSIHGTIKGLDAFDTRHVNEDKMTEVLIEEITLTVGE